MNRDVHDPVVIIELSLGALAVVHVPVHDQDPLQPSLESLAGTKSDVVEVAVATGLEDNNYLIKKSILGLYLVPQSVVARRSDKRHAVLHLPGDHGPDKVDGAARCPGGGLPYVRVQVDAVEPRGGLPAQTQKKSSWSEHVHVKSHFKAVRSMSLVDSIRSMYFLL